MQFHSKSMTFTMQYPSDIIKLALRLYLNNQRVEAMEALSFKKYLEANSGKNNDIPDASSVLKAFEASIGFLEGMLSGSAETLVMILEDFWEAERLANNSPDREWIGNRVSRGMSYMLGGILQVFMGRYVKGGLNIAIAFKLIRDFEQDVLSIPVDSDKGYVRSLGLLVLSLLNFFAQVLPSSITSAGDLLGLGISKDKFREYIEMCHGEKGEFSLIAKLVLVHSTINSKNFVFEKTTKEEIASCRTLIDECLSLGPESVFVHVINASVCLGEGDLKGAEEALSNGKISAVISRAEWSNMELAVGFKLGVIYLCGFEFSKAERAFKMAADSIAKTPNRWHYVPFMRALQGLSHMAGISPSCCNLEQFRSEAISIFSETFLDRDLSDGTVVLPGDHWGARTGYEQTKLLMNLSDEDLKTFFLRRGPVFNVLFALMSVLYHFEKIDTFKLDAFFRELGKVQLTGVDEQTDFKIPAVEGEYYRKKGDWDKSVSAFDDAIERIDRGIQNHASDDKDSILGFCLVLQGAALAASGDTETAKEVLSDLSDVLTEAKDSSIMAALANTFSYPKKDGGTSLLPGNLVKPHGGELALMLSFRRNGLRRKIMPG